MRWFRVVFALVITLAAGKLVDADVSDLSPKYNFEGKRIVTRPLPFGLKLANPDEDLAEDERRLQNERQPQQDGANFEQPIQDDEELMDLRKADEREEAELDALRRYKRRARKSPYDEIAEENQEVVYQQPRRPPPRLPGGAQEIESDLPVNRKVGMLPVDLEANEAGDPPEIQEAKEPLAIDNMVKWTHRVGSIGAAGAGLAVVAGIGACCVRSRKQKVLPITTHDAFGGRHMSKRA